MTLVCFGTSVGDQSGCESRQISRKLKQDNRQSQAKFLCVDCGYKNNADVVGAINGVARGHRVLACGEPALSGRSVKQEPAEASQTVLC